MAEATLGTPVPIGYMGISPDQMAAKKQRVIESLNRNLVQPFQRIFTGGAGEDSFQAKPEISPEMRTPGEPGHIKVQHGIPDHPADATEPENKKEKPLNQLGEPLNKPVPIPDDLPHEGGPIAGREFNIKS